MEKIAIFTTTPYAKGGVGKVTIDLANMLAVNYNIDIICTERINSTRNPIFRENVNLLYDDKIHEELTANTFTKVLRFLNKKFWGFKNIAFLQYIYLKNHDFSHTIGIINNNKYKAVIGVQLKLSLVLGYIAERINTITIGWQHNSFDAYFNLKHSYYWNQHNLAKKYLSKLDRCVVLTKSDANRYQEYLDVKAQCIYNPVQCYKSSQNVDEKDFVLWVGRLEWEQKGLDYLLEVCRILKKKSNEINVVIVGDGAGMERLRKEIQKNNLQDMISLKGYCSDVSSFYENASVLISTSKWEGFGLTLVEAMSHGVPVVAFDNSGPHEILCREGGGILIAKYACEDFANTILNILHNQEYHQELSEQAMIRAKQFSFNTIRIEWVNLIEGVRRMG